MRHPAPPCNEGHNHMEGRVIDIFSIHDSGENIFNVYSNVNIVQLTTFKQAEHERNILCSLMTSSMQPVTTAYRNLTETLTGGLPSA